MLRVERFGLGLYVEGIGEMHRAQVSAEDVSPSRRRRGNEPVNAAGIFRISLVTEPGEPAIGRSRPESVPAFIRRDALPGLIVARSREEARQILLARKLSALGSPGQHATTVSQRDEGPHDQAPG